MLNKKAILSLVGIYCLPFAAKAKVNPALPTDVDADQGAQDLTDLDIAETCSQLIRLNEKNEISTSEHYVGQKLYGLIEQISHSPIDYCDEIQMAQVVEQEPH